MLDEPMLIWTGRAMLDGYLNIPEGAQALIVVAGLGGRLDGASSALAERISAAGFGTLIADILTADEQQFDARTGHFRVDLPFLADRIRQVVTWAQKQDAVKGLPLALLASGAAASAGLLAASEGCPFFAVVLTRPRLDLVREKARSVAAPALVIVDDDDFAERSVGRDAASLGGPHRVDVLKGVSALTEDIAVARAVALAAVSWIRAHAPVPASVPA